MPGTRCVRTLPNASNVVCTIAWLLEIGIVVFWQNQFLMVTMMLIPLTTRTMRKYLLVSLKKRLLFAAELCVMCLTSPSGYQSSLFT
mmetsp:Transcript_48594/g.92952  ORF Transcript_48594/g.92952 Transcript_48594/m.92952 type:complete len:87 (-) Transcript_48594:1654-1914(-)